MLQGNGTPHFSVYMRIWVLSYLVQQELLLDVANVPQTAICSGQQRKARLCSASAGSQLFQHPLAGVSLLSAALDGDTHRTAVVSHSAEWWVLVTALWCLQMSVPRGVILGIRKVGSIPSQKPILVCLMVDPQWQKP